MSMHMKTKKRSIEVAARGWAVLALIVAWSVQGRALAFDKPTPAPLAGIAVSFKLDPRLTQSLYMGERWVAPASYNSVSTPAGKSITVEARAHGFDAQGRTWKISPEWIPSDPEMVAVSPGQGNVVVITVQRPGASSVTLKHGATSKTLSLRTVRQAETWRVDISQELPAPRPPPARPKRRSSGHGVTAAAAGSTPSAHPQ